MDSLIKQTLGKEPFLSFSGASDSPFQLIRLLNSFDCQGSEKIFGSSKDYFIELKENSFGHNTGLNSIQSKNNENFESAQSLKGWGESITGSKSSSAIQPLKIAFAQAAAEVNGDMKNISQVSISDISGWPLLSPARRPLQKCDKCSREFCSSINYRRHIRVHRRSLNSHKDSPKNRHFMCEFWDKLSVDEAKELASLKSATVEEISGSSVTKALSTLIQRPSCLSSLPQIYIKAGLALLDVVQARPPLFPVTSHRLFNVLDDASENTFLCAGTALSVQKYVFDGEAVKNALEIRNLVALTSFLIEKELLTAWLADKDAEALRCQKLLVEEEEFALKRQAEILERKRLKKLRQKEEKAKERMSAMSINSKYPLCEFADSAPPSTDSCSAMTHTEDHTSEVSLNQGKQLLHPLLLSVDDMEAKLRLSLDEVNLEKSISPSVLLFHPKSSVLDVHQMQRVNGFQQENHVPIHAKQIKHSRPVQHSFVARSSQAMSGDRDLKSVTAGTVWTKKFKPDSEEVGKISRGSVEKGWPTDHQSIQPDRGEVMIGSINVSLKNSEGQKNKLASRAAVELWRPVSRHGNDDSLCQNDEKIDVLILPQSAVRISTDQSSHEDYSGPMMFSCEAAKAFLAQRWKAAIAGEHVAVVASSPETEAPGCPEAVEGMPAVELTRRSVHGRAEKQREALGLINPSSPSSLIVALKPNKIILKTERSFRFKFVPREKNTA